jgi:hypothetical protein
LIVLAAMTPVVAAGLVADAGRPWFWKSLRWFHAAAFTPVLMVLMLGVGVQMTSGVAYGRADTVQHAIGTAVPGVLLIVIACFAPLALFKLLAFVDPTTNSGAALRTGLSATDTMGGFLAGHPGAAGSGATEASSASREGRSSGEAAADDATAGRFSQAQTGLLRSVGGGVGTVAAAGVNLMDRAASTATAVGSDLTDQMGVGHPSYHPFIAGAAGNGDDSFPNVAGRPSAQSTDPGLPPQALADGQGSGDAMPAVTPARGEDGAGGEGEGTPRPASRRGRGGISGSGPAGGADGPAGSGTVVGAGEEAASAAASVPIVPI